MRPLKLTLSAFGSYIGAGDKATVINFEEFGDRGIFLITGNTGSGKTLIFDAISFALFGRTITSSREPGSLRSLHAAKDADSFVSLDFSYRGKKYTVTRWPRYKRLNKNGNYTDEAEKAELKYADGRIIKTTAKEVTDGKTAKTTAKDVTAEIQDNILGMEYKQFAQVAMIAQGEYRKLLEVETKERSGILRYLFHTDLYEKLQERLKDEHKNLDNDYKSLYVNVTQAMAGISFGESKESEEKVKKWRETGYRGKLDEALELLGDLVSKDAEAYGNAAEKLKGLEQDIESHAKELEGVRERMLKERSLKNLEGSIAEAEGRLEDCGKQAAELEDKLAGYREAEKDEERAEQAARDARSHAGNLRQRGAALKGAREELAGALKAKNETRSAAEGAAKAIEACEKQLEELEAGERRYAELPSEEERLKLDGKDLEQVEEMLKARENAKAACKQAKDNLSAARAANEKAIDAYLKLLDSYNSDLAAVLAGELDDGVPCPVCGSRQHPAPAKRRDGKAPAKAEVEKAEKASKDRQKAFEQASTDERAQAALLDAAEGQLLKKGQEIWDCRDTESVEKKAKAARADLDARRISLNRSREACESIKRNILRAKENLKGLRAQKDKAVAAESRAAADASSCETRVRVCSEELLALLRQVTDFATKENIDELYPEITRQAEEAVAEKEAAAAAARGRTEEKAALERALRTKADERQSGKIELARLIAGKEEIEKSLLTLPGADNPQERSEKLAQELEKSAAAKAELTKRLQALHTSGEINGRIAEAIRRLRLQIEKCEGKLAWLGELKDTMCGTAGKDNEGDRQKESLEEYVQSAYFDRILGMANARLRKMSNGQYELVRRREGDARKRASLDLDIKDHWDGSVTACRGAGTLSGGEAFYASLALALGVADEAGGTTMDSLFIDEGFGSLDADTLDNIIQILDGLSEGKRLVGIISHVEDLRQRIGRQLRVTKVMGAGRTDSSKVAIALD